MQNKTVFVSGHFNVLHPGQLRLLRFAKECGNRLIVAVESDRIAGRAAHDMNICVLRAYKASVGLTKLFLLMSQLLKL